MSDFFDQGLGGKILLATVHNSGRPGQTWKLGFGPEFLAPTVFPRIREEST